MELKADSRLAAGLSPLQARLKAYEGGSTSEFATIGMQTAGRPTRTCGSEGKLPGRRCDRVYRTESSAAGFTEPGAEQKKVTKPGAEHKHFYCLLRHFHLPLSWFRVSEQVRI